MIQKIISMLTFIMFTNWLYLEGSCLTLQFQRPVLGQVLAPRRWSLVTAMGAGTVGQAAVGAPAK